MNVYWFEQTEADVPAANEWLSATERERLTGMQIAKRRADWRLGRWTAKCAVALYLGPGLAPDDFSEIELRPAACGAPDAFVANQPAAVAISPSHRAGTAACAVGPPGAALGCDLELIEPHSDAFIADFFAAEEQALLARSCADEHDRLAVLIWSAKESALKALHVGLRADTRSVVVSPTDSMICMSVAHGWQELRVRFVDGQAAEGWWQSNGQFLRTLVAAPPPLPPISLQAL